MKQLILKWDNSVGFSQIILWECHTATFHSEQEVQYYFESEVEIALPTRNQIDTVII